MSHRAHPGAAASLREGMEETLTVTRLAIAAGEMIVGPQRHLGLAVDLPGTSLFDGESWVVG